MLINLKIVNKLSITNPQYYQNYECNDDDKSDNPNDGKTHKHTCTHTYTHVHIHSQTNNTNQISCDQTQSRTLNIFGGVHLSVMISFQNSSPLSCILVSSNPHPPLPCFCFDHPTPSSPCPQEVRVSSNDCGHPRHCPQAWQTALSEMMLRTQRICFGNCQRLRSAS